MEYVLNGHEPVKCDDSLTWARWLEQSNDACRVARDTIGESDVSTVFLGLDHNFGGKGPPVLFETMVFGGPLDGEQERYSTWAKAEQGHAAMCELVRATN